MIPVNKYPRSNAFLRKALVATAIASLLSLSACSSRDTQPAEVPAEPDVAAQIKVVDQRDKEVVLDAPAQRIATTVIPSPAIIAAVDGSWDRIVGINESTLKANQQGLIGKIYPASTSTQTIASSNFEPNMDVILELKPDVVIQWGHMGEEITGPIEESGLPMVGLRYGTQEDLKTWITLFGTLIGKEDRADQIISKMDTHEVELGNKIVNIDKPKPKFIQLSYTPEALSVPNKGDYMQFVADLVGGDHASADVEAAKGKVTEEQIIAWNPEVIFLSAFDESTPEQVYADPRFADIAAVKDKRVYKSPLGVYRWQVPCAESPLFWNWAAKMLYPEDFDVDLRSMMREEISYLYNYDLTDEDIDHTLRTDLNKDSANYDVFAK